MKNVFNLVFLLNAMQYVAQVDCSCQRDPCKRKQYTPLKGYHYTGKILAQYEEVPLRICIRGCRKYYECHSFNMKWMNPSRTIGKCSLLEEVTIGSFEAEALLDEDYTHYCKCTNLFLSGILNI